LFREIVGNLCVHTDFSSGFAYFFHVFKDRVVTKNPTRLLPEIPEGELTIQQLSNYTKNPLLVRVFHELHWAEDLGSGTRNILRYAPIYYPLKDGLVEKVDEFVENGTTKAKYKKTGAVMI
jgi:ATP-dependent DNA helicase RecG